MTTTPKERAEVMNRLTKLGISHEDARSLRRISMTLRRWFELECGDSNTYYSWAIVRGKKTGDTFEHDDNGKPYMERRENRSTRQDGKHRTYWVPLADRETGAKKRLAKIMEKYPDLTPYIQTDPRGAALYLVTRRTLEYYQQPVDEVYSQGVAVY